MPPTLEDDDHGGDTIIVKGEIGWSHPSSPESLPPELERLGANLLGQVKPQRELESPEPYDDTPSRIDRQSPESTRRPSRRPKANVTTMEDRLQLMPEKRPLPWRPGVEEGADTETGGESRRKQIRFGCLLATRGEVQIPGCNSCMNGRGKFSLCVALDGYFKGACASCQLSGRPNRCSMKKDDDVVPSPAAAGTPSGDAFHIDGQQSTPSNAPRSSGPPRKRRRTSEVKRANEAKRTSSNGSTLLNPPPPQHHPPQWGQQAPPAQQVIDLPQQKSWATVNQPPPRPTIPSSGTNGNGHTHRDHYIPATPTSWATVNQPHYPTQAQMQPQIQPQYQPQYQPIPRPQVAPPVQRPIYNSGESNESGLRRDTEREGRESTVEEGSVALIDSLPKNKQRQVYGLVSGLQGGIEHLQRELDALKRAMGIEE